MASSTPADSAKIEDKNNNKVNKKDSSGDTTKNSEWQNEEINKISKSNYNMNFIKAAGIGLSKKIEMKYVVKGNKNNMSTKENMKNKYSSCQSKCSNFWIYFTIWRHSFKQFEANYGSGVLAYFDFLKTMFLMNVLLTVLIVVLVILPQALNYGPTYRTDMISRLNITSETAATCSVAYYSFITSYIKNASILTYVQDVLQGTGFLEEGILFIGYYFPEYFQSGMFTNYHMPLAYIVTFGLVYILSLVFMLIKTGSTFKQAILSNATQADEIFFQLTFSSWNFSLMDTKTVAMTQKMMYNTFVAEIDEKKHHRSHEQASTAKKVCIVVIRVIINLLILGMLSGAGYLIYYVQQVSVAYTTANKDGQSSVVFLIYSYLPAITIALVGGILPVAFEILVTFEGYRTETAIFLTILRTIVVNLSSLAMIMVSIFSTLVCTNKSLCNTGTGTCTEIKCWETYVGQEFYKIAIMFFLISFVKTFVVDFGRALIGTHCTCKIAKLIGPAEFLITKHTLEVLTMQITLWFGVFFCPFLAPMNTVTMFILFYLKKFGCYFCYKPSERPFKASKATTFFMAATFITYFICIVPVGFLLTQIASSRTCSPFRRYNTTVGVVDEFMSVMPGDAYNFLKFVFSPGFIYFVFVLLIITAYYYYCLAEAEKIKLEMHEKALREEGQKKQLLASQYQADVKKPLLDYRDDPRVMAAAGLNTAQAQAPIAAAGLNTAQAQAPTAAASSKVVTPAGEESKTNAPSPQTVARTINVASPFEQGLNRVR